MGRCFLRVQPSQGAFPAETPLFPLLSCPGPSGSHDSPFSLSRQGSRLSVLSTMKLPRDPPSLFPGVKRLGVVCPGECCGDHMAALPGKSEHAKHHGGQALGSPWGSPHVRPHVGCVLSYTFSRDSIILPLSALITLCFSWLLHVDVHSITPVNPFHWRFPKQLKPTLHVQLVGLCLSFREHTVVFYTKDSNMNDFNLCECRGGTGGLLLYFHYK